MDKIIKFEIVTPERTVLKEDVVEVTVPTAEGEVTILPHHAPLIATLKPGVLVLKKSDGAVDVAFTAGGFLEVLRNKVVVLADTAERAEEIDLAKVEEARARAEKAMKEVRHEDAEEFARVAAQLEHELAKTRAINRWKNIKI
ncbi:MAG TPA: ATP synthase F1 subunit epsilon [Candidatus Nanoarchaeia archaeon]|nr:ATP synthase F1 subunit epsilon [Candidatus Nanoarchaeia archaeon]